MIYFDGNSVGLCRDARFKVLSHLGEGSKGYALKCEKVGGDKSGGIFVVKMTPCKRWKQVSNKDKRI